MRKNHRFKLFLSTICLFAVLLLAVGCAAPAEKETLSSPEQAPADSGYKDGTYEGVGTGNHGEVKVAVTIAGGKIADVTVVSHSETEGVGTVAVEKLPGAIVEAQSTEVEAVTGASVTSKAIIEAVNSALQSAK